jgi:hypothetical protein
VPVTIPEANDEGADQRPQISVFHHQTIVPVTNDETPRVQVREADHGPSFVAGEWKEGLPLNPVVILQPAAQRLLPGLAWQFGARQQFESQQSGDAESDLGLASEST